MIHSLNYMHFRIIIEFFRLPIVLFFLIICLFLTLLVNIIVLETEMIHEAKDAWVQFNKERERNSKGTRIEQKHFLIITAQYMHIHSVLTC